MAQMAISIRSVDRAPLLGCTKPPRQPRVFTRCSVSNEAFEVETKDGVSRRALAGLSLLTPFVLDPPMAWAREERIYDFSAELRGVKQPLEKYRDQNLNYPGLRTLCERYGTQGFNLIAFPCNQFGKQAPGSSEEERAYAIKKFGFEFDVYDKIEVNGLMAHPLYRYLKRRQPESLPGYSRPVAETGEIEWNYTKFLIDREGRAVRRYRPGFDPLLFENDVVQLLKGRSVLPPECLTQPEESQCRVL